MRTRGWTCGFRADLAASLIVAGCVFVGCRAAPIDHQDTVPQDPPVAVEDGPSSAPRTRTVEAARGESHPEALNALVLDPRGQAALTLDEGGGVRLWPRLEAQDYAPYSLPAQDPLWMSLAQAPDGFTVAFVDTDNGAQVWRVVLGEAGRATIERGFEIPPTDPMFELHALDSGGRILALGVDHRLRLYDRDGTLLSQIDEQGFAPWQLRVTGGDGREPLHLAVTLAGPLRVQEVMLQGDRLARVGTPREIALDRGPNRNDLALSPDGRFVAALRRRTSRGKDWSVEIVELDSGTRRLIGGRLGTSLRPRMHLLSGDRLLLESGDGVGHMVELSGATELVRRSTAEPDSALAKRLARSLTHPLIALSGSAEGDHATRDDETGLRYHASVRADLRAALLEGRREFVVHGVDATEQLAFTTSGEDILAAAIDARGARLAWVTRERIHVEPVGIPGERIDIPYAVESPARISRMAFTDADHLVIRRAKAPTEIIEITTGARAEAEGAAELLVDATRDSISYSVAEGPPPIDRLTGREMFSDEQPQDLKIHPKGGEPWVQTVEAVENMAAGGGRIVINTGRRVLVFELKTGELVTTREDADLSVREVSIGSPHSRITR